MLSLFLSLAASTELESKTRKWAKADECHFKKTSNSKEAIEGVPPTSLSSRLFSRF
jgi:hypothetical protein